MATLSDQRDPVEQLAEEFVERHRRGERPSIAEYTDRYPEHADQIRDLFPALVTIERLKPRTADLSPDSVAAPLVAGTKLERLGDYRILREVGRGGMGIVYEAEQESLARHVALKLLPATALLDSKHLERFRREARAAARLHHTNIVPVFGVGEHAGVHYYVMQFIHGLGMDEVLTELRRCRRTKDAGAEPGATHRGDLARPKDASVASVAQALLSGQSDRSVRSVADGLEPACVSTRPAEPVSPENCMGSNGSSVSLRFSAADGSSTSLRLPGQTGDTSFMESGQQYWHSVARIGLQVAEALAYAHSQGTLHRDIKPSNLLLDTTATVWVTDFGLAKAADAHDLTGTGDVVGTLRYMAPERFRGESDVRSDIYSLGLTLHELLTLRPAFEESDRNQLIRKVTHEEPSAPRKLDPAIPRDLETIVLKAIAKEPSCRYESAERLSEDLRRFLDDRPIHARRLAMWERTWRWCRRNPMVAGLAASVAVLIVLLGAGLVLGSLFRLERDKAIASEGRSKDAEERSHALLQRAIDAEREVKIRSHLAQAIADRRSGQMGQRFKCLDEVAQAMQLGAPEELRRLLRTEAVAALAMSDLRVRSHRTASPTVGLQFDYPLQRYSFVDLYGNGEVVVRRFDDDRELIRTSPSGVNAWHAATEFSPDGRYLLACYWLRDAPDDSPLLQVWDIAHKQRILEQRIRSGATVMAATFHPGARWLLFVLPDLELCVWDIVDRREVKRLPLGITPYSICLDGNGKRVAANDVHTPHVKIVDIETGNELASWKKSVGRYAMSWSSDSKLLASGDEHRVYVWNVAESELASVLRGHSSAVVQAQFAHQGHLLITSAWDGTTRFWDAGSGEPLLVAPGAYLRLSQDDRELTFVHGNTIGLWELAHGRECRTLHPVLVGNRDDRGDNVDIFATEISPDETFLAISSTDGVRLCRFDDGRELAHLKVGDCHRILFAPGGESFLTIGVSGVHRWPIRRDQEQSSDVLQIGPPQLLLELDHDAKLYDAAWMPDHRAIVVTDNRDRSVMIVDMDTADQAQREPRELMSEHRRVTNLAVSPDGRWIAAGGWKERGIQVWNLATGELACVLSPGEAAGIASFYVQFSPDGRWLVSHSIDDGGQAIGHYFRHVGTWEPGYFVPATATAAAGGVFSRDGSLMALSVSPDQMMLADPSDGHEITRLSCSNCSRLLPMRFTRDGSRLLARSRQDSLQIWDLPLVHEQLAEMNLDWDQPTCLLTGTDPHRFGPTRVTVEMGDIEHGYATTHVRRAAELMESEQWQESIDEFEKALQINRNYPFACNNFAWLLATCDAAQFRDAPRSVQLARQAVELNPKRAAYHNTLGVAHYRTGDWTSAITELMKAEQLSPGEWLAHNAFFLAMSHWQLGEREEARKWYSEAIDWLESNRSSITSAYLEEIRRFRTEAEELMIRDN